MPKIQSRTLAALGAVSVAAGLSACANLADYNTQRDLAGSSVSEIFVDAKQRAIITVPAQNPVRPADSAGHAPAEALVRFCAEPSPDALTALATSGNLGLTATDKINLTAAFSASENASNIGLRTQSIQLMRDAAYRLCEASASGMLTSVQYETLLRRFQSSMVAILAIEQLTGVVKVNAVVLSPSEQSGAIEAVAGLADKSATTQDALAKAQQTSTAKDAASAAKTKDLEDFKTTNKVTDRTGLTTDALKATYDQLKTGADAAKADADTAKADVTRLTADLQTYQTALAAIGAQLKPAGGPGTSVSSVGSQSISDAAAVADAVKEIVSQTLDMGFLRESCATMLTAAIDGRNGLKDEDKDFRNSCKTYFDQTVDMVEVSNKAVETENAVRSIVVAYVQDCIAKNKAVDKDVLKILLGLSDAPPGSTPPAGAPAAPSLPALTLATPPAASARLPISAPAAIAPKPAPVRTSGPTIPIPARPPAAAVSN